MFLLLISPDIILNTLTLETFLPVWCLMFFPVKIQVNFSRSIIVAAGPRVVIGQRVVCLVSHWSLSTLGPSSALIIARWLCRGLQLTGTLPWPALLLTQAPLWERNIGTHTENQWFLICDTSKGYRKNTTTPQTHLDNHNWTSKIVNCKYLYSPLIVHVQRLRWVVAVTNNNEWSS